MTKTKWGNTVVEFIKGDITQCEVDAIVNAANSGLLGGGGVDGAIHKAGGSDILEDCKRIVAKQGRLPTGKSVITTGGDLIARHVIHTVGPVWKGGTSDEAQKLRSCYRTALELADQNHANSIAFPAISTGVYGYPFDLAAKEAVSEVNRYLSSEKTGLQKVVFVLFDAQSLEAYQKMLNGLS